MRDKFSELASVVRRLSAPGNAAADLPETSDRYELEVDGILRDAAGKLASFRAAAGKRVEAVSLDAALAQARADFDARLTARTREFESQKRRAEAEQTPRRRNGDGAPTRAARGDARGGSRLRSARRRGGVLDFGLEARGPGIDADERAR